MRVYSCVLLAERALRDRWRRLCVTVPTAPGMQRVVLCCRRSRGCPARVTTVPWLQASTRVLVLVLGVVVLAACGGSGGAPAVWEPAPEADLSPQSTSIDVLVREMECASGRSTDERIMDPEVGLGDEEVVITFRVTPRGGDHDCQGNPATPYTVELGGTARGAVAARRCTRSSRSARQRSLSVRPVAASRWWWACRVTLLGGPFGQRSLGRKSAR